MKTDRQKKKLMFLVNMLAKWEPPTMACLLAEVEDERTDDNHLAMYEDGKHGDRPTIDRSLTPQQRWELQALLHQHK